MPYRCDIVRNTQNGDWKYKRQSWPIADTDIRKNIRLAENCLLLLLRWQ